MMSVISYDISDGFVWVVSSTFKGFPVFLSVHTDKGSAWEAVLDYVAHGEFGSDIHDFSIIYCKLNRKAASLKESEATQ